MRKQCLRIPLPSLKPCQCGLHSAEAEGYVNLLCITELCLCYYTERTTWMCPPPCDLFTLYTKKSSQIQSVATLLSGKRGICLATLALFTRLISWNGIRFLFVSTSHLLGFPRFTFNWQQDRFCYYADEQGHISQCRGSVICKCAFYVDWPQWWCFLDIESRCMFSA